MSKHIVGSVVSTVTLALSAGLLVAVPTAAAHAPAPAPVTAPVVPAPVAPAPELRAANAAARVRTAALVSTGPSVWTGASLVHPRGLAFYPQVTRWADLVRKVMAQQGIPEIYLAGILSQIQQESAGDPIAVNNWDSNAKAGTPSMGLLQMIAPTYQAYARKRYRAAQYQTMPYTNIWAALNYAKSRYGLTKFASWSAGSNVSY